MSIFPRIILCCAFCLLTVSIATAQHTTKARPFHTEGVFGNITAGPGGDYGGMQIYLTDADGQFYATVTIAEGVLLPPVLVKVQVQTETRKIEFTLPNDSGGRKFTGTVSAGGLTLFEGKTKSFLKRICLD
ncbi:MAG TPA: hypothetical protein VE821_13935 [Pyrinomonadaceae bacterium]|nr:hypothetical protein [Pyrinomonadaceae bacterium]